MRNVLQAPAAAREEGAGQQQPGASPHGVARSGETKIFYHLGIVSRVVLFFDIDNNILKEHFVKR